MAKWTWSKALGDRIVGRLVDESGMPDITYDKILAAFRAEDIGGSLESDIDRFIAHVDRDHRTLLGTVARALAWEAREARSALRELNRGVAFFRDYCDERWKREES